MSAELHCEPISEAAFAPFGLLLCRPAPGGKRMDLRGELQNARPTAKSRFTLATAPPRLLPMVATQLERHVYSSQTFTPIDGVGYLVLVAAHKADGTPDITGLKAFRVPGDVGVHYFADTWRHPLTPLERPATFVVLTFIDGGPTDEEWFDLPTGIDIVA